MPSGEFVHVPLQVLGAELVERALVRPLEQGPEGLDAIGVNVAFDVFLQGVLHRVVVEWQRLVRLGLVRVDRGALGCMVLDEALKGLFVSRGYDLGRNLLGGAIPGPDHGCLAHRPAPGQLLALRVGHVATFAAHVRFVHFDRTLEQVSVASSESLADAVRHVPGGALRDGNVPVQLPARNALEMRRNEEQGEQPVLIGEIGRLHEGARLDGEEPPASALLALAAAQRHRLVAGADLDAAMTATRAANSVLPAMLDEPRLGCRVVGEQLEELLVRDALAIVLSRCLVSHSLSTSYSTIIHYSDGYCQAVFGCFSSLFDIIPIKYEYYNKILPVKDLHQPRN